MANLAQYDITPRMAPYLDPHFMFPILKWLREKNIYPEVDVLAAEYELSSKSTTMLSFVDETHKQLVEATKAAGRDASAIPAPELNPEALKAEFEARLKAGKGAWDILANKETVAELQKNSQLTLEGLVEKGATTAEVDSIFDLARFYHKSGLYKQALETIVLFRKIGPQDGSYRYFSTMWAQLAECICMLLNPDTPSTKKPLSSIGGNEPSDFALRVLRDTVEKRTTLEGVKEVEQRRWMMHWALFVVFSRPKPHEELFDLFFSPREARSEQRTRKNDYLAIAQAVSPWLLRYVAYSAVLNHKNIGKRQKQFVQILQAEKDNYSGPMTRLFTALFVDFDMDAALAAVRDSSDAIRADFFLGGLAARVRGGNVDAVVNDFQQAALRIVFVEILKLHQEVNYEQAVAKYFGDFPSVKANTLRLWVAEIDRSSSSGGNSGKTPTIDETKESVQCHQLFNVQITTIHQRIDQQTNELKNTASKLRNRFNEDRAFERDMGGNASGGGGGSQRSNDGGGGGGSGKKVHFELTPFTNQVNSRDPRKNNSSVPATTRGRDSGNNNNNDTQPVLSAPTRQNSRWQQAEPKQSKAAAMAKALSEAGSKQGPPSPTNDSWKRKEEETQQQQQQQQQEKKGKDSSNSSWERAPKSAGSAESSSWR